MAEAAGIRWRLADPSGILVRPFGDEALVFNPLTWETHLLNDVGLRVLEALSGAPKTEAQLVKDVCGEDDEDRDELVSMPEEIGKFVSELETLGLIERAGEDRGAR